MTTWIPLSTWAALQTPTVHPRTARYHARAGHIVLPNGRPGVRRGGPSWPWEAAQGAVIRHGGRGGKRVRGQKDATGLGMAQERNDLKAQKPKRNLKNLQK